MGAFSITFRCGCSICLCCLDTSAFTDIKTLNIKHSCFMVISFIKFFSVINFWKKVTLQFKIVIDYSVNKAHNNFIVLSLMFTGTTKQNGFTIVSDYTSTFCTTKLYTCNCKLKVVSS